MAVNIKRIINKQNLTGTEVGKALVANTAAAYKNLLKTRDYGREPKGIFGQAEMDRIVAGLKTNYDIDSYNSYVSLNNYIAKEQGFVNAYQQQAQLGYYKLFHQLNAALTAEHSMGDSAENPLIMTQKQYDDYCKEILSEERAYTDTYLIFLGKVFSFYYKQYKQSPRKKNPLSTAIKASMKKVIKNERILGEYVEMWGCGHYVTKDGISSADCSAEEWQEIVSKIIYGEEKDSDPFIYTGMSAFSITNYINSLKDGLRTHSQESIPQVDNNLTWVYDDDPDQLEAEEILEHLSDYYPQLFEYADIQEEVEKQLKEFDSDFPELYEALKKEAARLLPAAKSFSIQDFEKPIATWGELADKGILDYKEAFSKIYSHQIIEHVSSQKSSYQGMFHGIAILRDEDLKESNVDERGYFIQPDLSASVLKGAVQNIVADGYSLSFIEDAREEELKGAMREIYAFNAVIDLISEVTGVDVSIFSMKPQTDAFEQQISAFNGLVRMLYKAIKDNALLFEEEDRKSREKWARNIFPEIDLETLKPTAAAIEKTRAYISDLTAFNKNTPLIIEMLKEREEGEADE